MRVLLLFSTQATKQANGYLKMCADNPSAVHGQPVSLQLVGRRLDEEKVVMMGEVILDALKGTAVNGSGSGKSQASSSTL